MLKQSNMLKQRQKQVFFAVMAVGLFLLLALSVDSDRPCCWYSCYKPLIKHPGSLYDQGSPVLQINIDRKTNGTWIKTGELRNIMFYSALYDNRSTLGTPAVIRINAVTVLDQQIEVYCKVWTVNHRQPYVTRMHAVSVYAPSVNGQSYGRYVFTCPLPAGLRPTHVGIVRNKKMKALHAFKITYPEYKSNKKPLVICVTIAFGRIEPHWLVEWMEIQRILGVSEINVYNNSLHVDSIEVLQYYIKDNFVKLYQAYSFVHNTENERSPQFLQETAVLNDCLIRNINSANYIMAIDFDEMIVPRKHPDLVTMINDEAKTRGKKIQLMQFRNAFFPLNLNKSRKSDLKLRTQEYILRLPVNPHNSASKSIVDPQFCAVIFNHFCWSTIGGLPTVPMDMALAVNQHYKYCTPNVYINFPEACQEIMKDKVGDYTMVKLEDELTTRVIKAYKKLKLSTK